MSRTHKTNPVAPRLTRKGKAGVPMEIVHNHESGECDLPDEITLNSDTFCYYSWRYAGKNIFCSCDLCTGKTFRRIHNKTSRRNSNEKRRAFAADPDYYGDETYDEYNKLENY